MNTTNTLCQRPTLNFETSHFSEAKTQVSESSENAVPFFANQELPKDRFFAKFAKHLLDLHCFIPSRLSNKPLPAIGEKQLIAGIELLTRERVMTGCENAYHISFTLAELFTNVLAKGKQKSRRIIESIDLVGGAVPSILNEYVISVLQNLGIEDEWLTTPELLNQLLKEFVGRFSDLDFRLLIPQGSDTDIEMVKHYILEFFVEKGSSGTYKNKFRKILRDTGFTNFSMTKVQEEGPSALVGFKDAASGLDIDLFIGRKLKRRGFLFIRDSLHLPFIPMLEALKQKTAEALIKTIKENPFSLSIVPQSDFQNGWQAFIDLTTGIVRTVDIPSINCAGWSILLLCFIRGRRCLESDLEKLLLDKLFHALELLNDQCPLPWPLVNELNHLPAETSDSEKIAKIVAHWLDKVISTHLDNNPKAALALTLQACLSLKQQGHAEVISNLWPLMKSKTMHDGPIGTLIHCLMDLKAFEFLISLLEVKAFLFLNTRQEKKEEKKTFDATLIMHQGRPAIQLILEGFFLLIPFQPVNSFRNLVESWQNNDQMELLKTVEALHAALNPQTPYAGGQASVIGSNLKSLTIEWYGLETFLETCLERGVFHPLKEIAAEWLLACEVQTRTVYGSKLLESCVPELLKNYTDENQRKRVLQSFGNKMKSPEEEALYVLASNLAAKKEYDAIPSHLIWIMALTGTQNDTYCHLAYQFWKEFSESIPSHLKIQFSLAFIRNLSLTRPDLASEILNEIASREIPFNDWTKSFMTLHTRYTGKASHLPMTKSLLFLASAIKKIHTEHLLAKISSDYIKAIHWLVLELLKAQKVSEALNVALLIHKNACKEITHPETAQYIEEWMKAFFQSNYFSEANCLWLAIYRVRETSESLENILKHNPEMLMNILKDGEGFKNLEEQARLCIRFMPLLKLAADWQSIVLDLSKKLMALPADSTMLQNAYVLISTLPPHAQLWKALFQHAKAVQDKDLSIKAWKLFFLCKGLQGTPKEIAEAYLSALKTMAALHPHSLLEVIGQLDRFLSLFEDPAVHRMRGIALLLLFNSIQNKNDTHEQILMARQRVAEVLSIPFGHKDWKDIDQSIAEGIALTCPVSLQIPAFKIQATLGKHAEAAERFLSLLQLKVDPSETEDLLDGLLISLASLGQEKLPLAGKILTENDLINTLKHNPSESLQVILELNAKISASKAATLKITKSIFKHAFALIQYADSESIASSMQALINLLTTFRFSFSNQPELNSLLVTSHEKLVSALQSNHTCLYQLLSEIKRLELDFLMAPSSIESHFDMFFNVMKELKDDKKRLLDLYNLFQWFVNDLVKDVSSNSMNVFFKMITCLMELNLQDEAETLLISIFYEGKKSDLRQLEQTYYAACFDWAKQFQKNKKLVAAIILAGLLEGNEENASTAAHQLFFLLKDTAWSDTDMRFRYFEMHFLDFKKMIPISEMTQAALDFADEILKGNNNENLKKIFHLLTKSGNIPLDTWLSVLCKTLGQFKDLETLRMTWRLFWKNSEFRETLSNQQSYVQSHCWNIVLKYACVVYPKSYFHIFRDINRFIDVFKDPLLIMERLENIHMLLTDSVKTMNEYNPKDKQEFLKLWHEAKKKLEIYYEIPNENSSSPVALSCAKVQQEVLKASIFAYIQSDDESEFELGSLQLITRLRFLPETADSVVQMSYWLKNLMLTKISKDKRVKILNIIFEDFIPKVRKVFHEHPEIPSEISSFFITISKKLNCSGILKILSLLNEASSAAFSEMNCRIAIAVLKKKEERSEKEYEDILQKFVELSNTSMKNNFVFSKKFFQSNVRKPVLMIREIKNSNLRLAAITSLILLNHRCLKAACDIDKGSSSVFLIYNEKENTLSCDGEFISERVLMIGLLEVYLPLVYFHDAARKGVQDLLFSCFLDILQFDHGIFQHLFEAFINSMSQMLNEKYENKTSILMYSNIFYCFSRALLDRKCISTTHFINTSLTLKNIFLLVSQNLIDDLFQIVFYDFIFLSLPDPYFNGSALETHHNNIKIVVTYALQKHLFQKNTPFLFQSLLMAGLDLGLYCDKLTPKQKEKAIIEMLDRINAINTIGGELTQFLILSRKKNRAISNHSPTTFIHFWRVLPKIIKAAITNDCTRTFDPTLHDNLNALFFSPITNPNKSHKWQAASILVCKNAFNEISHPNNYEIDGKQTIPHEDIFDISVKFLKKTLVSHCFSGQLLAYFELVEILVAKFEELIQKKENFSEKIFNLISLDKAFSLNEEELALRAAAMTKWIEQLAHINISKAQEILDQAIEMKIYHGLEHHKPNFS